MSTITNKRTTQVTGFTVPVSKWRKLSGEPIAGARATDYLLIPAGAIGRYPSATWNQWGGVRTYHFWHDPSKVHASNLEPGSPGLLKASDSRASGDLGRDIRSSNRTGVPRGRGYPLPRVCDLQEEDKEAAEGLLRLGQDGDVRCANAKRGPLAQCILNYWTYAQKEDPNPLLQGIAPVLKKNKNEMYREAIDLAEKESVSAAMDHLNAYAPTDYVQRMDQLTRSLTAHRDKKMRVTIPPRNVSDFENAPEVPEDWKVLFLWGKTGLGKTQFAKALLPEATIVRHRNQLNQCDFSKGIIFDDFDVSHWPPSAVIHLLDWDEVSGIDVKYGMVTIPPRTRKIFTFNKRPDAWAPLTNEETFQAILRRMHVIELNERLY